MSLQLAAQHIADKGRGPDTTLVHMSNKEVKSLNDLAMAHGGQLTINPQTGLPEAGFLSSILPMVAGMALNAYAPGLGSVMTGALVGGASYLMNPKAGLMGGVMAGLGAYGGANMGEALATQGMQQAGAQKLTEEATKNAALEGGALPSWYQQTAASTLTPAQIAAEKGTDFMGRLGNMGQGVSSLGTEGGFSRLAQNMGGGSGIAKTALAAAAPMAAMQTPPAAAATGDKDMGQRYTYSANKATPLPAPDVPTYQKQATEQGNFGREQEYFVRPEFKAVTNDEAKNIYHFAGGGPVEQMSNNNAIGANTGFPQAYDHTQAYATPYQTPISQNVLTGPGDISVDPYTGEQRMAEGGEATPGYTYDPQAQRYVSSAPAVPMNAGISSAMGMTYDPATQRFTGGGIPSNQIYLGGGQFGLDEAGRKAEAEAAAAAAAASSSGAARGGLMGYAGGGLSDARYNLGGYSDGGRLLRGPGDGVSDSIPATIGHKQPARLADGEFVVPARIVSELGNGSTEAGARKLYAMLDRVQSARSKSMGKGKVAKNSRADKYLPA